MWQSSFQQVSTSLKMSKRLVQTTLLRSQSMHHWPNQLKNIWAALQDLVTSTKFQIQRQPTVNTPVPLANFKSMTLHLKVTKSKEIGPCLSMPHSPVKSKLLAPVKIFWAPSPSTMSLVSLSAHPISLKAPRTVQLTISISGPLKSPTRKVASTVCYTWLTCLQTPSRRLPQPI